MSSAETIKIAVIDDDASLCHAMERLLRAAGFKAIFYPSAEAFLEDREGQAPHCILLDIQLGGMSGFQLQSLLVASGSTTPVIFITAHDDDETRAQARKSFCSAYLRKNDPGEVVLEAIRKAVHLA